MGRLYDKLVAQSFVENLIESIKLLKNDCEVEHAEDVADEVGRVTLEMINEYYEYL